MLAQPSSFYPVDQIRDLDFIIQFAVDRWQASINGAGERPHKEVAAFPALAALLDHPHELTALLLLAFEKGLCLGLTRDALVGHAREFLQEVANGLLAKTQATSDQDNAVAIMTAQQLMGTALRQAFDEHYREEVGERGVAALSEPSIDSTTQLTRLEQGYVLLQIVAAVVQRAALQRWVG